VFFGLTTAGVLALCAFGILPPDQFVELAKCVTILYAASTTMVAIVRHVWPPSAGAQFDNLAVTEAPTFHGAVEGPWIVPDAQDGVGLPNGFGSLHDDVFSEPIGHGVPPNYTSMVRDHDAPPMTTDGADGSPVMVPMEMAPPSSASPRAHPDLTLACSRCRPAVVEPAAPNPNVVILGDPPKKEESP
jgi:hypothetical protein